MRLSHIFLQNPILLTKSGLRGLLLFLPSILAVGQTTSPEELESFRVVGTQEQAFHSPGAGYVLEEETLQAFSYDDINQVLRAIPGVYVREEDGYGLFPNISLRGSDPGRSGKVTLMEDGVLMAPAPYSAPSAYYSPTTGRMAGIEVLKGSSQITQGPHTTGGVINYLSTPIPQDQRGLAEVSYGTDSDWIAHYNMGSRWDSGEGSLGYVFEVYHRENDGFKTILPAVGGGYAGSGDTGLQRTDYLLKLGWELNAAHRFEAKVGYSDMEANETYLGLSETDFARSPEARYPASRFDNIATYHSRYYLRHQFTPNRNLEWTTTAYYNRFHRNWYKLDRVNGTSLSSILFNDDPLYPVLNGSAAGELKVKANNRDYYGAGLQSNLVTRVSTGAWNHKISAGIRYHTDRIRRHQFADLYQQNPDGSVQDNPGFSGPDNEGDRRQAVDALAFYIQDEISQGYWTFAPGIRFESVEWDYFRADGRDPDIVDAGDFTMTAPGISILYQPSQAWVAFGGAYRGISPPSPSGARSNLEEERSNSFELGVRHRAPSGLYVEALAFYSDFENLITAESIANGGSDENIGEVDVRGFEAQMGLDLADYFQSELSIPFYLSATWTDATFIDPTDGQSDPGSIFYGAEDGNQLPYIPEWQFFARLGLESERWSITASAGFTDDRFGTGDNALSDLNDIRVGTLDAHWIVDVAADYQLTPKWEVFGAVTNAFDETYIASRLPHGLRPGAPAFWRFGARYTWD